MKKLTSFLMLLLLALAGMHAQAAMYILGGTIGWDPSKGTEMTQSSTNVYTYTLECSGDIYFSFTRALASSSNAWDAITNDRLAAPSNDYPLNNHLGEEVQCNNWGQNVNNAFKLAAGKYSLTLNSSTRKLKVEKVSEAQDDPSDGESTIYVKTTDAKAHIYAWNKNGSTVPFGGWPGTKINTLPTETVNGVSYYKATAPYKSLGVVFNNGEGGEGNQTSDLSVEGTVYYEYPSGGDYTKATVVGGEPAEPDDLYVMGTLEGQAWEANAGKKMTYDAENKVYTYAIENAEEIQIAFTTKLGANKDDWDGIAAYRWGADTDGNDFVFESQYLGQELSLVQTGEPGHAFVLPAGNYAVSVNMETHKVTFAGEITPVIVEPDEAYIMGVIGEQQWAANAGTKMAYDAENKVYTYSVESENALQIAFTTKLSESADGWEEIAPYRWGAVTDGNDFAFDAQYLGQALDLEQTDAEGHAFALPAGKYDITLDMETHKVTFAGEITPVIVEPDDLYVMGTLEGQAWEANAGKKMTYDAENKVYTYAIENAEEIQIAFTTKLGANKDDWDGIAAYRWGADTDGNDFVFESQYLGQELSLVQTGEPGHAFVLPAGNYAVSVNMETHKVTFAGEITPVIVEPDEAYIMGVIGEQQWAANAGTKMAYDAENKVYTYSVESENALQIAFTTKLSESADGWEEIAPYRWGAVTDGNDFAFDAQYLGQALDLEQTDAEGHAFALPAGKYDITLDMVNHKVTFDGEITPVIVEPDDLYVMGTLEGQTWEANAGKKMTYDAENKVYTYAIENAEEIQIAFTTKLGANKDDWDGIAAYRWGADTDGNDFVFESQYLGQELSLVQTGDAGHAFVLPAGNYAVSVNMETHKVTFAGEITPVIVEPDEAYIMGVIGEQQWAANAGTKMAYDAENKVYTYSVESENALQIAFTTKLSESADGWEEIAPYRWGAVTDGNDFAFDAQYLGQALDLEQTTEPGHAFALPAGKYDITLDMVNHKVTFAGEITPVIVEPDDLYVMGTLEGQAWEANAGKKMTYDAENKVYTYAIENAEEIQIAFTTKLSESADGWEEIAPYRWGAVTDGNDFAFDAQYLGQALDLEQTTEPGHAFALPAGKYDITLDMVNHKVTFAGEITPIVEDTKVYVLGEVNDNGGWFPYKGAEMATEDNNTFTLAITAAGENEGYSYFSFTKKLASTQPESTDEEAWGAAWEEIAPYRFGAVSEGDFLVTSETLNTPLALTTEGYQAYKIPAGEYTLTVNLTDMTLVIAGEITPVIVEPDEAYIMGVIGEQQWAANAGTKMAYDAENKVYTYSVESENALQIAFTTKLSESADGWEEIAPYRWGAVTDGNDFVFDAQYLGQALDLEQTTEPGHAFALPAGKYDITLDMVNHKVTFAGEITPIVEDTKVYVLGEVNDNGGWFPYKGAEMSTEDNNTFTLAITAAGENEGYSYFSFTKKLASTQPESTDEEAWGAAWDEIAPYRFGAVSEGDFLVTSETLNTPLALTTEGYQAYKIPAGEYTLTVNLTDMTLVIAGEITPIVEDTKVYVLGEVNDNGGWFPYKGAEMSTEDNNTFTLAITAAGENEGYSYFSFTKKLASTQPESTDEEAWGAAWEEIAPYRFGAEEGEGDCDVVLNQAMPLGADGTTRAYKIGKGEWKFNLDLEGLTLTVTRKALRGDVNNDGTVSSVDLAIIVNILAGLDQAENYDGRADVNGDGQISAVDISQIVNIIAGLEE